MAITPKVEAKSAGSTMLVYLRTTNGHLRRPIENLYPLGVTEKVINTIPENDKQEGVTRTLRGATEKAKEKIRQLSEN